MRRKHCEPQYGKNKTLSKSLHGMKNRGFNPPKTAVEIEDGNGIKTQFVSMAEAGRFLGKATSLVRYYANNGKQCNGYFIRYVPKV